MEIDVSFIGFTEFRVPSSSLTEHFSGLSPNIPASPVFSIPSPSNLHIWSQQRATFNPVEGLVQADYSRRLGASSEGAFGFKQLGLGPTGILHTHANILGCPTMVIASKSFEGLPILTQQLEEKASLDSDCTLPEE